MATTTTVNPVLQDLANTWATLTHEERLAVVQALQDVQAVLKGTVPEALVMQLEDVEYRLLKAREGDLFAERVLCICERAEICGELSKSAEGRELLGRIYGV